MGSWSMCKIPLQRFSLARLSAQNVRQAEGVGSSQVWIACVYWGAERADKAAAAPTGVEAGVRTLTAGGSTSRGRSSAAFGARVQDWFGWEEQEKSGYRQVDWSKKVEHKIYFLLPKKSTSEIVAQKGKCPSQNAPRVGKPVMQTSTLPIYSEALSRGDMARAYPHSC